MRRMVWAGLAVGMSVALCGCSLSGDHSGAIAQDLKSSANLKSLLERNYGGTDNVTDAHCTRSGSSQSYSCTVDYSVSGASDPRLNGSYQLPASATCDSSGNCRWQTQSLLLARNTG